MTMLPAVTDSMLHAAASSFGFTAPPANRAASAAATRPKKIAKERSQGRLRNVLEG